MKSEFGPKYDAFVQAWEAWVTDDETPNEVKVMVNRAGRMMVVYDKHTGKTSFELPGSNDQKQRTLTEASASIREASIREDELRERIAAYRQVVADLSGYWRSRQDDVDYEYS